MNGLDRCFTVQHPPLPPKKPLAVFFDFHGGSGNAGSCGFHPDIDNGKTEFDAMMRHGTFALVCPEAVQYKAGGGPPPEFIDGGRWSLPVDPGSFETGNLCEDMGNYTED